MLIMAMGITQVMIIVSEIQEGDDSADDIISDNGRNYHHCYSINFILIMVKKKKKYNDDQDHQHQ